MAREFDELESEVRRRAGRDPMGFLRDLLEPQSRGAPPPPRDPSVDTFNQRFPPYFLAPGGYRIQERPQQELPYPVRPGTRERFLDPTKVISDVAPPVAGRRYAQAASGGPDTGGPPTAQPSLPSGLRFTEETPAAAPKGLRFTDEPPGKMSRFLSTVTAEGPISGLIALARTAGRAAQGRAPELMTEEGIAAAIPEAVQGAVVGPGARGASVVQGLGLRNLVRDPRGAIEAGAAAMPKIPPRPEPAPPYVPPEGPKLLTSRLSPEEARAVRLQEERARVGPIHQRTPGMEVAPLEIPPGPGQASVPMAAIQPHINRIMGVARKSPEGIAALEGALPAEVLSEAMSRPDRAAAIASWLEVYGRVAQSVEKSKKFGPTARASLELATRNLNSNLGTELTLMQILGGP